MEKGISNAYAASAGWARERRALHMQLMQSGSCPGLALGLIWALCSMPVVVGHRMYPLIFLLKNPETGLSYSPPEWCFYIVDVKGMCLPWGTA